MKIIQTLLSLIFILSTTQGIAQVNEQANVENDSLAIDALTILPNGNVGIGINKPIQKLDVHGNVNVTGNINTQGTVQAKEVSITGTINTQGKVLAKEVSVTGTINTQGKVLAKEVSVTGTITTQGNVGIGSNTAQKPLDISKEGGIRINRTENASRDNEILFADNGQIRSLDDNHRIVFDRENDIMEMREHGDIVFSPGAEKGIRTQTVTFRADGNVGIGTSRPLKAKLVVEGAVSKYPKVNFRYMSKKRFDYQSDNGNINRLYSIYASNITVASEFYAVSDKRIKNSIGLSNNTTDLETLSKIEITDYTLIDTISKGNQTHKKVIAQQVKEVYPQAVSSDLTDVIPNIYALSAIKDGWIQTNTKDLVVGDKLKLIFSEDETLVDVLEIQGDAIKVASDQEGPVFVYGKQVSDFHTVDYEAIAMLNVSATQELLKRIELLEKDKETLSRKQKELEDHLNASVSRIEKLETLFNNLK